MTVLKSLHPLHMTIIHVVPAVSCRDGSHLSPLSLGFEQRTELHIANYFHGLTTSTSHYLLYADRQTKASVLFSLALQHPPPPYTYTLP